MDEGFYDSGAGSFVYAGTPVVKQLAAAGVMPYLRWPREVSRKHVRAVADIGLIEKLDRDGRFVSGGLHRLHPEVGEPRREWRSYTGAFGPGSLQIVLNTKNGECYADVDQFNPYQDAVNWIGHAGEVIGGLFRRKPKPAGDRA